MDALKWIKADAEVRDEGHLEFDYQELETIAPSRGLHRFAHCQVLYEEVHDFIKKRKWVPAQIDTEVAGITWIEMFALLDLPGAGGKKISTTKTQQPPREQRKEERKLGIRRAKNRTSTRPPLSRNLRLTKN